MSFDLVGDRSKRAILARALGRLARRPIALASDAHLVAERRESGRSRRALLGAAAGAAAASVVSAVARPLPAAAHVDQIVYFNTQTDDTVLQVRSFQRSGYPDSGAGTAVSAYSQTWIGVRGETGSGMGVWGVTVTGEGVRGSS